MHGPADILGHLDQMVGQSRGTMIERSANRTYMPFTCAAAPAAGLQAEGGCIALYDVWRVWLYRLYRLYVLYSVTGEP